MLRSKTGRWLLGPVGPAHAGVDGRVATSSQDRPLVTDGPYRCVAALPGVVELRLREDVDAAVSPTSSNDVSAKTANEKPAAKPTGDRRGDPPATLA